MLVLTRKQNEKIRIGDDITITIVRTKGKSVRLGIQAPSEVRVLRGEIVFDVEPEASPDETSAESNASSPAKVRADDGGCQRKASIGPDDRRRGPWPIDRIVRAEQRDENGRLGVSAGAATFGPLQSLVRQRAV